MSIVDTHVRFRAKSYKTYTKMSIITEYTEKINKVYNDSTLSKGEKVSLVSDLLTIFKAKCTEIGYNEGERHANDRLRERLGKFLD